MDDSSISGCRITKKKIIQRNNSRKNDIFQRNNLRKMDIFQRNNILQDIISAINLMIRLKDLCLLESKGALASIVETVCWNAYQIVMRSEASEYIHFMFTDLRFSPGWQGKREAERRPGRVCILLSLTWCIRIEIYLWKDVLRKCLIRGAH